MGYTTEEVMGHPLVRELITDGFNTAVQSVLDKALHQGETANFEFQFMAKSGARVEVLLIFYFSVSPPTGNLGGRHSRKGKHVESVCYGVGRLLH